MSKYNVVVKSRWIIYANSDVEVEADTKEDAEQRALEIMESVWVPWYNFDDNASQMDRKKDVPYDHLDIIESEVIGA